MPEWTINSLYFLTEEIAKKAYEEAFIDSIFTFEAILQFPTSPDGLDPKYIFNEESYCEHNDSHPWLDWYYWCYDHLDISWIPALTTRRRVHIYRNTITFKTSYNPPYWIIYQLSTKFNTKILAMWKDEGNTSYYMDMYKPGDHIIKAII